ncbi:Autophagy protein 22 [Brettanomyces nanus]|uniref:Autophagy-related protein n=1 Tax=Eeniella nana TaxID=13502 RepID=A0A875RPP1_EENNA|nr:Autophagy protein 22 [Brettanomyces nanus]QPG75310.1 Autophagy protein 22 [Brettanomyces nanus]
MPLDLPLEEDADADTSFDVTSQTPLVSSYNKSHNNNNPDAIESSPSSPFTSKLEILGWCLYAWASEPFIVSAVGTYVPIILEQIARDNGVKNSDKISPCKGSRNEPVPRPPPPGFQLTNSNTTESVSCVLPVLNGKIYIDTSSYALYTFSFSVLVQTICVISMSGAADRGSHRKSLLIGFAIFGALTTICYWFVRPDGYYMASFLAIVANSAYGCVSVCGNSFLSVLVNNSAEIRQLTEDSSDRSSKWGVLSSKISGAGAASGYVAALIVQVGTMFMLILIKNKTNVSSIMGPIKTVIGFVGLWWLVFQVPVSTFLKPRASPDLNLDNLHMPAVGESKYWLRMAHYKWKVVRAYVLQGYKTLVLAFKQASQLRDISFFLLGWFIVSDSLTTINSTAILFAKSDLQMTTIQLSRISILAMISAVCGSIIIPNYIQPRFNVDVKTMLIFIILWSVMIPFYGILGFYFKRFGLHHSEEMYLLAIWYGFSLGGVATVSRSIYSMLIPTGQESVFFALFSITDKGSSILGPLLVGVVIDMTHNIRQCFWVLLALLLVSIPVLWYGVDINRGMREATALSEDSPTEERSP